MARKRGVPSVAIPRAKWSVMWLAKDKKGVPVIRERKVDYDLAEAIRLHALLIKADRRGPTLRCTNVAFPPPVHVLEHEEETIEERRVKIKGKRRTVYVRIVTVVNKMHDLNLEGIWWCPYCMKFRKFREIPWEPRNQATKGTLLFCPMCDVSTRDFGVAKWNPLAWSLQNRKKR